MSGFVKRKTVNTVNPAGGVNPAQQPNVGQYGWTSFDANNVNQIIQYVNLCKEYTERTKEYADYVEGRFSELQDFMNFIEVVYNELKPIIDEVQPIYTDIIVRHDDIISRHINIISLSNQVTSDKIEINEIKQAAIDETLKVKADAIAETNKIKADAIADTTKIKQDAITETTTIKNQATSEANRAKAEADRAAAEAVKSANSATAAATSANNSSAEATKAAASAKDAADIAEELRKGQVYRGTWNIQANASYPPEPDTNSVWDITLNEGSTEYQFDGKKWYWGDRLLFLRDNPAGSRYSQIESGSTVISVNGKGGAVTLDATDVGAAPQFIPHRPGGGTPRYSRIATLATTDSDCSFILSATGDHGQTHRSTIVVNVATRRGEVKVDAKRTASAIYGGATKLFHRTVDGVVEVWLKSPSYQLYWGLTVLSKHSNATFTNDQSTNDEPAGLEEDTIHVIYSTDNKPTAADVGAIAVGSSAGSVNAVSRVGDTMTGLLRINSGSSATPGLKVGSLAHKAAIGVSAASTSALFGCAKTDGAFTSYLRIGEGEITYTPVDGGAAHKIYHAGDKPKLTDLGTIVDLGGVRKSGDDNVGSLKLASGKVLDATLTHQSGYMSIYPYGSSYGLGGASGNRARMYYKEHNNGNPSDISRGLVINSNDADGTSHPLDMWLNGNKVYHEGFKPTPSAIGAVNKAGDTMTGNLKLASNVSSLGTGALDANNSNIIGLNGLVFNDPSDALNEGILFPKTGKTGTSTVIGDYDALRALDGSLLFNANKVYHEGFKPVLSDVIGADNSTTKIYTFTKPPGIEDGKYYPILFSNTDARPDVFIDTTSSGGEYSMNNCSFKGQVRNGGWSDRGSYASGDFTIYSTAERAIHSIVGASESSNHYVIYVEARAFPIRVTVDSTVNVSSTGKDTNYGTTTYRAGISGMTASGDYGTKTSLILDLNRGSGNYNSRSSLLRHIGAFGGITATERVHVSDYNENGAFITRRPGKPSYSMMGQDSNGNTMLGLGVDTSGYSSYLKVSAGTLAYSNNGSTESRIYHEGFKPSLSELGGIASTGGTMTGTLTLDNNSAIPLVLKRSSQVGINFKVGSTDRYLGVAADGYLMYGDRDNHGVNSKIYHQGFKPTATDIGALPLTGGVLSSGMTISTGSSHLKFRETDASNKEWHIEGNGGNLAIVETGASTRATFKAGGGVTLSGQLDVNGSVVLAQGNILKFPSANYSAGGQIFTRDGGQYGSNMVITSGGNMIIGGGESAVACANELDASTTEHTYITADGDIYFSSNGNTWADRKTMTYTASGVLNVPIRVQSGGTVKLYDNATKRGLSLSTNSTGYAEIVLNKEGTEQWNTGLRAYNDIDWRIGSHRIYHEGFKPDITTLAGGKAIGLASKLGSNLDLDDFKTPGVYYQDSNNNATSGMNYPEPLAGSLVVYQAAGVIQEYRVYNTSRVWSRAQYSNGAWSTWAKQYNSANKPTANEVCESVAITTSVNLNDYETTGFYNMYKGSGVVFTNAPDSFSYGTLEVIGRGKANSSFVTQTLTQRSSNEQWFRTRNDGSKAWSGWSKIYNSSQKPTAADVGAVNKTGDTMTGVLNVPRLEISGSAAGITYGSNKNLIRSGTGTAIVIGNFTDTTYIDSLNGDVKIRPTGSTEYKIYHQGFKPTAADVGAAPIGFGLGESGITKADANDLGWVGGFFGAGGDTGKNYYNKYGPLIQAFRSGGGDGTGQIVQIQEGDGTVAFRNRANNVWSAWTKLYSTNFKPTAAEVGAVNKTGDTMTGNLNVPVINSTKTSGTIVSCSGNTDVMGINPSWGTYLHSGGSYAIYSGNASVQPMVNRGGTTYKLYHEGNKPTAADVGAMPLSGGTFTNQVELSVRKSAMVVKNQASIRFADQSNTWFHNYVEGNDLVWSTGNDSSMTRRMALASDGTLGLTGGFNVNGTVACNSGIYSNGGYFQAKRDLNPMFEWHKPGISAVIAYLDGSNELRFSRSNGSGGEASQLMSVREGGIFLPITGKYQTNFNSNRAWTNVGHAAFYNDSGIVMGNGTYHGLTSLYSVYNGQYAQELSFGYYSANTDWRDGKAVIQSYNASSGTVQRWMIGNNGTLEPAIGNWRIQNTGWIYGSSYGGFFHEWCQRMFAPISDGDLKTVIGDSKVSALDEVSKMKFHAFVWKDSEKTKQFQKRDAKVNRIGLIAQEVEAIDPSYTRDVETYAEDGSVAESTKTLDTANLLAVALKAIQELQAEVADLKEKLNELV